jgi:hypothetical protein
MLALKMYFFRWGFRMIVKGVMSTHSAHLPWTFDLEKTCAYLAGKCATNLIGSPSSVEGEGESIKKARECFQNRLLSRGAHESLVPDDPDVLPDANIAENSLEMNFLNDLIELKGDAGVFHEWIKSNLKGKLFY